MKIWPYTWHDDKPEEFHPPLEYDPSRELREQNARWWSLIMKWVDRANVAKAYHVPLIIDEDTWAEINAVLGSGWNPYNREAAFRGVQVLVPFDGGGKLK